MLLKFKKIQIQVRNGCGELLKNSGFLFLILDMVLCRKNILCGKVRTILFDFERCWKGQTEVYRFNSRKIFFAPVSQYFWVIFGYTEKRRYSADCKVLLVVFTFSRAEKAWKLLETCDFSPPLRSYFTFQHDIVIQSFWQRLDPSTRSSPSSDLNRGRTWLTCWTFQNHFKALEYKIEFTWCKFGIF